ncbi:MAG: AAA domain-containing protein [Candidatus Moranbacteria bacterium]|nr:AAA domain-containing protein [Candidatus Moranbacteria bacterium]
MTKEISSLSEKPINFFHWYYNGGIHGALEIWKNFLFFSWRYFSIVELFSTLFYPWHRDVSFSGERGFNPVHLLEILFENLISRFIGGLVRISVILFGLISLAGTFLIGIFFVFFWRWAPLIFIALAVALLDGSIGVAYAVVAVFWIILSVSFYLRSREVSLSDMDKESFLKNKAFERVCGRLGMSKASFPVEILENSEMFGVFLKKKNISIEEYEKIVLWEFERLKKKREKSMFWDWGQLKKAIPIGVQWRYGFTVNLDRYSQDLSANDFSEYAESQLVGRRGEDEILRLILGRPDQNCALLVGDAGIGKKTLVHHLAAKIRSGQENGFFQNIRVVLLDLGLVISDTISHKKSVENVLRKIFYEVALAGNVVLVVEHIENYLRGEENMLHPDISSVLVEFLALPTFRLIATSTSEEYHQLIEKKQQIAKYFEIIEVGQPTEVETIEIMLQQLEKYEQKRVLFSYRGIREIVASSTRQNWNVPLPERALDLMMDVFMFWAKKPEEQYITEKTINKYLSLKTGVRQGEIDSAESRKLLNLENDLHRQVVGQDNAVNQISEALRRARSGVGDKQKPVGSFLFLGPTGVGKTETAKALAKTYFGDEKNLIRLDMSEFQSPNSIDRLLGSSQLNQQGRLISQIKKNPYSLLLLDEIEKAYPDILDIFLQILDEGFVTDAFGEKINFRNCLIIATSNAGAVLIKKMVEEGRPAEEIKTAIVDWIVKNNVFKVEFLNRFDDVIFFRSLQLEELVGLVNLKLAEFAQRLEKEKNIQLDFEADIAQKIIQKGYNPVFGARSLNRYIEDTVENLVAKEIISGQAKSGERIKIGL